jgi:hypothetical protein
MSEYQRCAWIPTALDRGSRRAEEVKQRVVVDGETNQLSGTDTGPVATTTGISRAQTIR